MFDEQTDAFERLVVMGSFPRDHKQQKGYDYITDLKEVLRKVEQKEKDVGKHVRKHVGKKCRERKPSKSPYSPCRKSPNFG